MIKQVAIDEEELNAVREQAASALPWKSEAERLALALRREVPHHKLLRSEIWQDFFRQQDEAAIEPSPIDTADLPHDQR